jgi:hypothetical protein
VVETRPLAEFRELGYTRSANLLVRYLKQGRADAVRKPPSPRRLVSWLMTRPADVPAHHRDQLDDLLTACAHLKVFSERVKQFADLLTARRGGDLDTWMTLVDADDLPALHGFVHGLRRDLEAAVAGLTLPYSNGPSEGANTKVRFLKRRCTAAPASPSFDNGSCSRRPSRRPPFLRQSRFLDPRYASSLRSCGKTSVPSSSMLLRKVVWGRPPTSICRIWRLCPSS